MPVNTGAEHGTLAPDDAPLAELLMNVELVIATIVPLDALSTPPLDCTRQQLLYQTFESLWAIAVS